MRYDMVPTMSIASLLRRHRVQSIGVLKVDVEGLEDVLIRSIVDVARKQPALWPRVLKFEVEHVDFNARLALQSLLAEHRYVDILKAHTGRSNRYNRVFVRL